MKKTMSTYDVAHALLADEYAGWSYKGAFALAEWLEQYDEETGSDTELDVVALRCDFDEYSSAYEAAEQYGFECGKEEEETAEEYEERAEEEAREWLEDRTTVIPFEGGVIIQAF